MARLEGLHRLPRDVRCRETRYRECGDERSSPRRYGRRSRGTEDSDDRVRETDRDHPRRRRPDDRGGGSERRSTQRRTFAPLASLVPAGTGTDTRWRIGGSEDGDDGDVQSAGDAVSKRHPRDRHDDLPGSGRSCVGDGPTRGRVRALHGIQERWGARSDNGSLRVCLRTVRERRPGVCQLHESGPARFAVDRHL